MFLASSCLILIGTSSSPSRILYSVRLFVKQIYQLTVMKATHALATKWNLLHFALPVVFDWAPIDSFLVPLELGKIFVLLPIYQDYDVFGICVCTELDDPISLFMLVTDRFFSQVLQTLVLELFGLIVNGNCRLSKPQFESELNWLFAADQAVICDFSSILTDCSL